MGLLFGYGKEDKGEDLKEAHNDGQKDYAEGKDSKSLPMSGLLSNSNQLAREKAYREGYRHARSQDKK
ncbi:MAG: hypothetical protein HQL69_24570 [Magnetococcales bacterium]|nr:hypothetical protein [Magnetococcales bacterium]